MKNILLILVLICVFIVNSVYAQRTIYPPISNKQYNQLNPKLVTKQQLPPPLNWDTFPSKITQNDLSALFTRYQQRAAKFDAVKDDYVATFDLLMDQNMVIEGLELTSKLHLALKSKFQLFDFETIGLKQLDQTSFTYSHNQTLHFLNPRQCLKLLVFIQQPFHLDVLKQRGFRQSDMNKLIAYIKTIDPRRYEAIQGTEFMLDKLPKLLNISNDTNYGDKHLAYKQFIQEMYYRMDYRSAQQWRQWIINLLNQLDPQRQRILKTFLVEDLYDNINDHTIRISTNSADENSILDFEQRLLSGELQNQLKRQHQRLQLETK